MEMFRSWTLIAIIGFVGCSMQPAPEDERNLRLYVFDCGRLQLDGVAMFGLGEHETSVRELFVPCYLIDHPRGRLLWDAGLPLSAAGAGTLALPEGTSTMSYARSLLAQLQDIGLTPHDIDYVALSHMHFDHAGAANAFNTATLLIQQPEYEAAFLHPEDNPIFDFTLYNELANADRQVLSGDHDVFGDGKVTIISSPGHTPGHQSLLITLADFGPLMLSGDLYHFRASRTLRRTPEFNTDTRTTLRSMDKVEALIAQSMATLWIEHDLALANTLNLAPAFYE